MIDFPNFVLFALRPKAYGRRVVSFVVNNLYAAFG